MADKIYGNDAINAFVNAQGGGLVQSWAYSPNGGWGGPAGQASDITQERFLEIIEECREEEFDFEFDGETLVCSRCPSHSVHQYYKFDVGPAPGYDGEAVACSGAHYGPNWGSSCEEIKEFDGFTKTDELLELIASGEYTEEIGLKPIDDPTDDGTNWVVVDKERFVKIAAIVAELADKISYAEEYVPELWENIQCVLAGQTADEVADRL